MYKISNNDTLWSNKTDSSQKTTHPSNVKQSRIRKQKRQPAKKQKLGTYHPGSAHLPNSPQNHARNPKITPLFQSSSTSNLRTTKILSEKWKTIEHAASRCCLRQAVCCGRLHSPFVGVDGSKFWCAPSGRCEHARGTRRSIVAETAPRKWTEWFWKGLVARVCSVNAIGSACIRSLWWNNKRAVDGTQIFWLLSDRWLLDLNVCLWG